MPTRSGVAPRIHGKLLKLGIKVSPATVAKYKTAASRPSPNTPSTASSHLLATRRESVTHVSDTFCYLCVGSLTTLLAWPDEFAAGNFSDAFLQKLSRGTLILGLRAPGTQ